MEDDLTHGLCVFARNGSYCTWSNCNRRTHGQKFLQQLLQVFAFHRSCMYSMCKGWLLPDDNNDAVKDVVWVPDVAKQAESQQHEAHLQDKHTGKDYVTDLQHVGELLGLKGEKREGDRENERGGKTK